MLFYLISALNKNVFLNKLHMFRVLAIEKPEQEG